VVVESPTCPPVRRNKAKQSMGGRAVGGGEWGEGSGLDGKVFLFGIPIKNRHHNGKHGHLLPLSDSGPRIPKKLCSFYLKNYVHTFMITPHQNFA